MSRVVEILVFPAVQLLDVTGPLQVFASANDVTAKAGETPPYEIRIVAAGGQSIEASSGMAIVAHPLSSMEAGLDTLVIAGGDGVDAAAALAKHGDALIRPDACCLAIG
jgi:transcriptional regulator GlxA family with amidase domain